MNGRSIIAFKVGYGREADQAGRKHVHLLELNERMCDPIGISLNPDPKSLLSHPIVKG
jgi:hypothetical protein